MTDKQIIECKYKFQSIEKFAGKPYCTLHNETCEFINFVCDKNCQVYEDYKQLLHKEQECEELKEQLESTKGLAKIRYQWLEAVKELANNANLPNISLYIDSFLNEEPQKINEVEDGRN